MTRLVRIALSVGMALAITASPAAAQTLGELGGTMGLTDTLAGTGYPDIDVPQVCSTTTLPDLDEEGNVIPRDTTCTGGQTTTSVPQTQGDGTDEQPAAAPQGHANGYYCKGQSKKRARGERGTAFSRCVTAMRNARRGTSPAKACTTLSRKRVRGQRATAYSRCVSGARRLQRDLAA